MNRKLEILISIPLCILSCGLLLVSTIVHHLMVKDDVSVKRLKRATFAELKKSMLLVSWEYDPEFPCSLFDKNDYWANYFHGSIFRFGDVGYLLTPYGLLMANIFQRRFRKTLDTYTSSKKAYVA